MDIGLYLPSVDHVEYSDYFPSPYTSEFLSTSYHSRMAKALMASRHPSLSCKRKLHEIKYIPDIYISIWQAIFVGKDYMLQTRY